MLKEHDRVVLTEDLPEHGLMAGDVGAIVFASRDAEGYTVEFMALDGNTVAVIPVLASQVRAVTAEDFPHVRRIPAMSG